jgi:hypothetical protein
VPFVLAGYGLRGLNEPDEGRYALIALALADGRSGWWLPQMSDYLHLDKPPLAYGLTALALRLFGPGEWAARLPSAFGAVAALGGLAFSFILATRARQVEVGLSSVTVPAGLFATHEVTIPFRHIQSTLSERGRGGLQLTILHRGRTTIVPAACLPKPHGLAELRDLILQRTAQIGRGETPHLRVNSRSAAATPRAQMPATFGRRRDAMAGRAR